MYGSRTAAAMLATMLFPRSGSLPWRLKFDTLAFERDFSRAAFFHERAALLQALIVLCVDFAAWLVFSSVVEVLLTPSTTLPCAFAIIFSTFVLLLIAFFVLAFRIPSTSCRFMLLACSVLAVVAATSGFVVPSLLYLNYKPPPSFMAVSPIGVISLFVLTVFLTYTLTTVPLIFAIAISMTLTVAVDILLTMVWDFVDGFFARLLIYLAINIICIFVRTVYESRMRTGFWYGAQSLLASKQLDVEKRLRQRLVLSIMPQAFAEKIFSPIVRSKSMKRSTHSQQQAPPPVAAPKPKITTTSTITNSYCQHETLSQQILETFQPKPPTIYWLPESNKSDIELLHEFHVEKYENVSIIYANICGFTKISSKKQPEEWVPLLNDIFDHFDKVCWDSGCERISILGDRYICLSGCPTPKADHAQCCVEAGLGMCQVIATFNAKYNEELTIHVAIHTGTLQCGLFGTQRYKFDIWGDDVNFSNDVLESSDTPGRVLVSADTFMLIKDDYETEEGQEIFDFRKSSEVNEFYDPIAKRMVIDARSSSKKTTKTFFIGNRKCATKREKNEETDATSNVKTPLLPTKPTNTDDASGEHLKVIAPKSFTKPPVQSLTLCFNRACVESDYNNRAAYEPLPLIERYDAPASLLKKSSSLIDFYAAGGLNFSPNEQSSPAVDAMNKAKKKNHYIPNDNERCLLSDAVFPNWISYGDTLSALIVSALVLIVCIISFPMTTGFVVAVAFGFVLVVLFLLIFPTLPSIVDKRPLLIAGSEINDTTGKMLATASRIGSVWRVLQVVIGSLFTLFPALIALISYLCQVYSQQPRHFDFIYVGLIAVGLLHFAFFAQVPYYVRTTLAAIVAGFFATLIAINKCQVVSSLSNSTVVNASKSNELELKIVPTGRGADDFAATIVNQPPANLPAVLYCPLIEVLVSLLGIVLAIGFVARRSEMIARLAWYVAAESRAISCAVQKAQKRNDKLLAYVVPLHILERFSQQQMYYQHHPNCGIIVVRIVNFADYYEESFSGRDASLHVLNQIFAEFEALLEKRRFKDVEKVKTSVPCLLCAAGLDAHRRTMQRENTAHLHALMAYCFELVEVMRKFNKPRQFKFQMRIGYSTGDLVSGILGSTLLHYDVWGDTVNVANTMCMGATDTDGVIQVSQAVVDLLKDKFNFEEHGTIFLSGKGDINTYLAVSEKPITYAHLAPPPGSSDTNFVNE